MVAWAGGVGAVVFALVLLGLEVWVVAIALLAYVVSREVITVPVLIRAGLGLVGSAITYIVLVILAGFLVSP